jgi:tRNA (guanine-N7-)-methyltransferase
MIESKFPLRHIRSFVRRDGRMTQAQRRVLVELWLAYGCVAPRILEIGFGSGASLWAVAKENPGMDFIGIEMYQPGVGSLLLGVESEGLTNIRVFYADAVEVIKKCIPDDGLDGVQIFFPDPWPKRRHHKRRLIQEDFVKLIVGKLKRQGVFHLATDWEHYGMQMMEVLSADENLLNLAGAGEFGGRSSNRPVVTKFEGRGTRSGRRIWELHFARC